jgi:hypothetical protein
MTGTLMALPRREATSAKENAPASA